jgi:hypothetical protein
MAIWNLEPVGELEFGGDVVVTIDHPAIEPQRTGPLFVRVRWDSTGPERATGEVLGDPEHARSLMGGDRVTIEGRVNGRAVTIKDVHFTEAYVERSHEHGPRPLGIFIAGDVELRSELPVRSARPSPPWVVFYIPDDPVWLGYKGHLRNDEKTIDPPRRKFEFASPSLSLSTTHVVYSGGAEVGGQAGRAERIALAVRVGARPEARFKDLDSFVAAAQPLVDDLLLVAGLAARRPFHALGGVACMVRDGDAGPIQETVEFTRIRTRHPAGKHRSFNDIQIEKDHFEAFLGTAMKALHTSTTGNPEFLRLAVQSYVSSIYRAFDTQQFLSICTSIEAMREWHARRVRWHKVLTEDQRSAVTKHVTTALIAAAKEGNLPGKAHTEAREKILELFRPRITTVLNELIGHLSVRVDDLFERDPAQGPQGSFEFDFIAVRNNLVHQGRPPKDPDAFFEVTRRARYLAERLLFAALGLPPSVFLRLQHRGPQPAKRKRVPRKPATRT